MMMIGRCLVGPVFLLPCYGRIESDDFLPSSLQRQQSCEDNLGAAISAAASGYVDEADYLVLQADSQFVATQTSHSESTNLVYKGACESVHGAWSDRTFALDCWLECLWEPDDSQEGGHCVRGGHETDVYLRHGACLPRNPECDHYVRNPVDWEIDWLAQSGLTCTATEDVNATYNDLIAHKRMPASVSESRGTFVDRRDHYYYNKTKRNECQKAINSIFTNEKYELYSTTIELFQVSPFLIQKESFVGDEKAMARFGDYCRGTAEGSRLDVWNGTIDCLGLGSQIGRKRTMVLENVAECFPPGTACMGYTTETWTLDHYNSDDVSCTSRNQEEVAEEGQVPPNKTNVNDGKMGGSSEDETTIKESRKHGQNVDKNKGKNVTDDNITISGGISAGVGSDEDSGTERNTMVVDGIAGLVALAAIAFVFIHIGAIAANTEDYNVVAHQDPELIESTLEMT